MVKRVSRPFYAKKPHKKRRHWWRGAIGALLTALIVVPYMMGSDLEKYLRHWVDASNQEHGLLHLELQNYHRHWLSSEADLTIQTSSPDKPLVIHLKAYHGPLCLKAGQGFRFGLGYLEGSLEAQNLLAPQQMIAWEGPIHFSAFIPYFSERELKTSLPAFMIKDQANNLVYHFQSLEGSLDADGLLQLELPILEINYLDGNKAAELNTAVLRIQPRSLQASLSLKQITLYTGHHEQSSISNFVLQSTTEKIAPETQEADLAVNLHFDQLKGLFGADELMELGPFECQVKIDGLQAKGFGNLMESLKQLSTQGGNMSVQEGENLEKAWTALISKATVFKLDSKLSTSNGNLEAFFQGGFKPSEPPALPTEGFYSLGSIRLSNELKENLSKYVENSSKDKSEDLLLQPLTLLLDLMKQEGQGYATKIEVQEGRILFNDQKPVALTQ